MYTNIHKGVLRATEKLFDDGAWSGTDEEIHARFQLWIDAACEAYDLPHIDLIFTVVDVPYHGAYLAHAECIMLAGTWSVVTLFHEFRHHYQQYRRPTWSTQRREIDAQGFAC